MTHKDTQPSAEIVHVTPAIAAEWLGSNTHNRNVRERTVARYARDMLNGDWRLNGETVKFASDETLLDAQHRLLAVVRAGETNPDISVPMWVIRGLPKIAQDTVDIGLRRAYSDVLALRGEKNCIWLASVLRQIVLHEERSQYGAGTQVSHAQMDRALEASPWLREGYSTSDRVRKSVNLPGGLVGYLWWRFIQIDHEDTNGFFEVLISGANIKEGSPLYALRRALRNSESVKGERNTRYLAAITIKAWNAYRAGEDVGLLKFRPGGVNPEKFPEPQ